MLFLASVNALRSQVVARKARLDPLDLPLFVHEQLGVQGIVVPTDFLAGYDVADLDRFRAAADKSGCPCLALIEMTPQALGSSRSKSAEQAADRLHRVLVAANRLGCSSVGFSVSGKVDDNEIERTADALRVIVSKAERLELNLLLRPSKGLTEEPDRVTDLIKAVGGFRLGTMPSFQDAADSGDPEGYLRKLAPYAPIVLASSQDFGSKGEHEAFDLTVMAGALVSIGFDAGIALDFTGEGDIPDGFRQTREAVETILLGDKK